MKKSNFVAMVLGTVSGVFFALGMCMALLPEWGMRSQGTVCGVIGMALALVTWLVWRKMEGKAPIKVSGKTVGTILLGVWVRCCWAWACACAWCSARWCWASWLASSALWFC